MNDFYIYGRRPIIAAIKSGANISKIYLQYGTQGEEISHINSLAISNRIPITEYDKNKFNQFLFNHNLTKENHQGIVALREIGVSLPLFQLINESLINSENPILLFLDEIQDPHNLGSIARTAEAAGVAGLIITESKSSPITPIAYKTSAGALEYLPFSVIKNSVAAIEQLKEAGFSVIASDLSSSVDYRSVDYNKPIALIIGNEGSGIRPHILRLSDLSVHIPMYGKTESLNASVSAGILIYEIINQRESIIQKNQ